MEGVGAEQLIFEDTFEELDMDIWEHDITMAGGGNWEFQYYTNNRTNSFVDDGVLYLQPTLTEHTIGEENVRMYLCMCVCVCVYVPVWMVFVIERCHKKKEKPANNLH